MQYLNSDPVVLVCANNERKSKIEDVEIRYDISDMKITRTCTNFGTQISNYTKDFVFQTINRFLYTREDGRIVRKVTSCIAKEKLLLYLFNLFTISNAVYETEGTIHFGSVNEIFVMLESTKKEKQLHRCEPFCELKSEMRHVHQLDWYPSQNIEKIVRFISNQLIIANTCNFRFSLWKINRIFDENQMIRSEYYCTTVLESYIQKFVQSFKHIEFILNFIPFLFFIPVDFDSRVIEMIQLFKLNLKETTAKKWYKLCQNHQIALEKLCNKRDLFMIDVLKYPKQNSFVDFLNLFENSCIFRNHTFHSKINVESYFTSFKTQKKLFAFISGGMLPFHLGITNDFNDIDIYLTSTPISSRNRGEFQTSMGFEPYFKMFFYEKCEKKCTIWKKVMNIHTLEDHSKINLDFFICLMHFQ